MIEYARFVTHTGFTLYVNEETYPFHELTTEVDYRSSEKERAQQHGLYPTFPYLGKRLWHFTGAILGDTSGDYMQKRLDLIKAFIPRPHLGYKTLGYLEIKWEGINELLRTECSLDSWPEIPMVANYPSVSEFQINLKSNDPRMYGPERSVTIVAPAITGTGRSYPKTYPISYANVSPQPSDVLVTNSGTIETHARGVIVGYVESPRLTLTRFDNEILQVALEGETIDTTDSVEIDFYQRSAIKNGDINLYNAAKSSRWWALEPTESGDDNVVGFSGANIQPGSQATLYWRNAYMI